MERTMDCVWWGVPELVSLQPCWTLSYTWATKGGLVLSKVYFNSQLTLSRYGDCVLAALSSLSWTQHIYLLQHCFSGLICCCIICHDKKFLYLTFVIIVVTPQSKLFDSALRLLKDIVFVIATQTWQVHMIGKTVAASWLWVKADWNVEHAHKATK